MARGIAIVAKGMGSTFLTVGRLMIAVIRASRRSSDGQSHLLIVIIAAVIAGLYLLWSNAGIRFRRVEQYIEQAIQAVSDAVGMPMQWIVFGLGRGHERHQRDGFQHLGEHQGYFPEQ